MLGIAIHCIQHTQAMLERGVCELAHSFFHLMYHVMNINVVILCFVSNSSVFHKTYMTVSPVNGKLYISDYMNHRIIQIATMGPVQSLEQNYKVIAGNGEECSTGLLDQCGDGGLAIQARLLGPKGLN